MVQRRLSSRWNGQSARRPRPGGSRRKPLSYTLYFTMKNRLSIKREYWPEVTDTPHFVVNLIYEGCNVSYDDIYFDDINEAIALLESLERDRKGVVYLQGGCRFSAIIAVSATGAIQFNFITESLAEFPGKRRIEGCFSISGEDVSVFLKSLVDLFTNGKEFII